ncbi:hypothetical protein NE237_032199 [Protea cynaroides]|uniref:Uncharacterized protein n=1 Tax=Protea cynaroides TaxID=273540 RepID=A0A9Q0L2W4_9MAGN|nr:hypothetical protein NE237_032199 [Protea cynaroides]
MEVEEVLQLYDSCGFGHEITTEKQPSKSPPTDPVHEIQRETSFKSDSLSQKPVFITPKLQSILLGKEAVKEKRGMRKTSSTKSISDLESEELKGFMDLGFVFSEEDKDSSLVSIIPGMQRLGEKSEEKETTVDDESAIQRPYLSEAWDVLDRRRAENPLMNWGIPGLYNDIDMKVNLRSWAHMIASTVR